MKKLIIIASLFLATSVFAQVNLLQVRINDFSNGQNSNDLEDVISPSQGELMQNVVINKKGKLSKRKGQDLFNKDVGSTPFRGLGRFDPDTNTSYMLSASGANIIRSEISSTDWTIINPDDNLTADKNTEFIQANKLLFILNGSDASAYYDGNNFIPSLGSTSGSPPVATTGVWLRNYLFLAGNPTNADWLYFSNNLEPGQFTVTDILRINTGDGQKIQRLEPYKLNELIIYKERSIYDLDITGTTPLSDWTVQPISKFVGCIAPRSVVNLGNDQWFLSSNPIAVRSLVRSQFDKILLDFVSNPIQDIFDGTGTTSINKSQASKSAAILFDSKYILAIPTASSTVNNTVIVYNFLTQGWYVIDGWYPAACLEYKERLFYIDANDGRVIEAFVDTGGDFEEGPNFLNSASDPTVAITFDYISKAYDFGKAENFKQLDSIELELESTGNNTASLFINLDNDGLTNVGTINLSGDAITLPEDLPFDLTSGGIARKTFHLQQYGEFKKIQVEVKQTGLGEDAVLQRGTIFAQEKPWRRE